MRKLRAKKYKLQGNKDIKNKKIIKLEAEIQGVKNVDNTLKHKTKSDKKAHKLTLKNIDKQKE